MEIFLVLVAGFIVAVFIGIWKVAQREKVISQALLRHAPEGSEAVAMTAEGGLPGVEGETLLTLTDGGLLAVQVAEDGSSEVVATFAWDECTFTIDTTERLYQRLGATRMLAIGVFSLAAPIRKEMVAYALSVEGPHGLAVFSMPLAKANSSAGESRKRIVLNFQSQIHRYQHGNSAESGP